MLFFVSVSLVSMIPKLNQIFYGDTFYLNCENATSGSTVKWYFNDKEQTPQREILKIAFAHLANNGTYHCESNGEKSDGFPVQVLGKSASNLQSDFKILIIYAKRDKFILP